MLTLHELLVGRVRGTALLPSSIAAPEQSLPSWCRAAISLGNETVRLKRAACERLVRFGGNSDSFAVNLFLVSFSTSSAIGDSTVVQLAPLLQGVTDTERPRRWHYETTNWLRGAGASAPLAMAAAVEPSRSSSPRVAVLYAWDEVCSTCSRSPGPIGHDPPKDWSAFSADEEPSACDVTLIVYSAPRRFAPRTDSPGSAPVSARGCVLLAPTPYETDDHEGTAYPTSGLAPFAERAPKVFYRGSVDYNWGQRAIVFQMGGSMDNRGWLDANASNFAQPRVGARYRYALDIGGCSGTTWDALRGKLSMGSLVFKVESGYVDWWHDLIAAGVHYMPIAPDLSDLRRRFEEAEGAPAEDTLARIAAARVVTRATSKGSPLWSAYRERLLGELERRPGCVVRVSQGTVA